MIAILTQEEVHDYNELITAARKAEEFLAICTHRSSRETIKAFHIASGLLAALSKNKKR